MSAKTKNALIVAGIVLLALKFRNQILPLVAKVPVVGTFIA